jgi:hypothetical protein
MLINYVLAPAAATNIIAADLGDRRVQVKASSAIASGNVVTGVSTNTAMVSGTSYIVSSLSPTMTLPVPAIGAWVVVTNYGSGTAVVSHNASEVIYGLGLGSSGSTTFSLGAFGATATMESDGTSWYVTAGNADSGWLTVGGTGAAWQNGWGNLSGCTTRYRKVGNKLTIQGGATGGTVNVTAFQLPAGFYGTITANDFLGYAAGTTTHWQVLTSGSVQGDGSAGFPEVTVTVD